MSDQPAASSAPTPAPGDEPKKDPAAETAANPTVAADPAAPELPEEWKPEPRKWAWKDVFTAPMLAFKPKCMLVAIATVLALWGFSKAWTAIDTHTGHLALIGPALCWLCLAVAAVIFSLGASLIAVFFKADLLDDEFLSLKEAIALYKGRIGAAVMVPLFLVGVVAGVHLLLWLAHLVAALPIVGGILYALLWPLGWLLALLGILLSIGALLAVFVGPAVIAVRKHGWFDNVIDTFEAVGTKPHKLVFCLLLTGAMMVVCYAIPAAAVVATAGPGFGNNVYSNEVAHVELGAQEIKKSYLPGFELLPDELAGSMGLPRDAFQTNELKSHAQGAIAQTLLKREEAYRSRLKEIESAKPDSDDQAKELLKEHEDISRFKLPKLYEEMATVSSGGFHKWVSGLILHVWQVLIGACIIGYVINVFLAGGMLTYLAVREDDYWDDEDPEDLDKLTKELEEQALKEEQAAKAGAPAAPAADVKPDAATAPTPAPAAPAAEAAKPDEPKPPQA
jgi:hypothetical protein